MLYKCIDWIFHTIIWTLKTRWKVGFEQENIQEKKCFEKINLKAVFIMSMYFLFPLSPEAPWGQNLWLPCKVELNTYWLNVLFQINIRAHKLFIENLQVKHFNTLKFYSCKVKIVFSFYLIEEAKHAVN